MTTLTQSELVEMRRRALTDCMSISNENTVALLDHIAKLTAERDEKTTRLALREDQLGNLIPAASKCADDRDAALARIAELELENKTLETALDMAVEDQNRTHEYSDKKQARIAELEAQSSAQFVAGMQRALHKLSNEVLGCASTFEPELRQYLGHTNFNILVARAEIARAILAEAALKGEGK